VWVIDPVLIILAAPYSHASLVCAMLGQHPEMYALPDTHLFLADDIEGVLSAHVKIDNGIGDGLLRLLAQIHDGVQSDDAIQAAKKWLYEHGDWTARQLLDYVHEKLRPKILVDSSWSTVVNAENFERMRRTYPDANYLHLVSHPRHAADAFYENRSSKKSLLKLFDGDLDGELVWYKPNDLISEFALSLPEGQCMRLMVEDLLANPENYLLQIAQWMDLSTNGESISAMLYPDKMPFATYGPDSAPGGLETEFLEEPTIPVEIGVATLADSSPHSTCDFSKQALKLGKEYGYR